MLLGYVHDCSSSGVHRQQIAVRYSWYLFVLMPNCLWRGTCGDRKPRRLGRTKPYTYHCTFTTGMIDCAVNTPQCFILKKYFSILRPTSGLSHCMLKKKKKDFGLHSWFVFFLFFLLHFFSGAENIEGLFCVLVLPLAVNLPKSILILPYLWFSHGIRRCHQFVWFIINICEKWVQLTEFSELALNSGCKCNA